MTTTNTHTTQLSLDQLASITGGVYYEPGTPERMGQVLARLQGGTTSTSIAAPIKIELPGYPPVTVTPVQPTPAHRFPR